MKSYIRWRHSKGYGVHSPYAYRFVTDVLRPEPYGYYAYHCLEEFLKDSERRDTRLIRLIRFIIRLACFLKTGRIVSAGRNVRCVELAAKALKLPMVKLETSDFKWHEGDLLIVDGDTGNPSRIAEAIYKSVPIFAVAPGDTVKGLLQQPIDRGLLLEDKNSMILIPRREMQYVAYDILLNP